MSRKSRVALVTGASRGIGKAIAIHLAQAGHDLAIVARTVHAGEAREHSPSVRFSDTAPLPGSLEETAQLVRRAGARCEILRADILDLDSLTDAVTATVSRLGRVDVLVNNARYIGAGHMDTALETTPEALLNHLRGNVVAPLHLDRLVLPQMVAQGSGLIVHLTSAAAYSDPVLPIGDGGWGLSYGVSKGAIHRLTGYIANEHGDDGILCVNVQPGTIATERIAQDMGRVGIPSRGEPADVVGAVVTWLATDTDAWRFAGRTVEAPFVCRELGLIDGYTGPRLIVQGSHDRAPQILTDLENALASGRTLPSAMWPID